MAVENSRGHVGDPVHAVVMIERSKDELLSLPTCFPEVLFAQTNEYQNTQTGKLLQD